MRAVKYHFGKGHGASYYTPPSRLAKVSLSDFTDDDGKFRVRIKRSVLNSDEAILANLSHELHEIDGLLAVFAEKQTIASDTIAKLITPDLNGTLHLEAWDVSNRYMRALRKDRGTP